MKVKTEGWTSKLDALIRPVDTVPPDSFTVAEYMEHYDCVAIRSARDRLDTLVIRGQLQKGKKFDRVLNRYVNAYWFPEPKE
jgi:hypothetical protein